MKKPTQLLKKLMFCHLKLYQIPQMEILKLNGIIGPAVNLKLHCMINRVEKLGHQVSQDHLALKIGQIYRKVFTGLKQLVKTSEKL